MDIYYVALIQNQGRQDESNAIFKYTDDENFTAFDKACEKFHYELCWRAEGRYSTICTILDTNLMTVRTDSWFRKESEQPEQPEE